MDSKRRDVKRYRGERDKYTDRKIDDRGVGYIETGDST